VCGLETWRRWICHRVPEQRNGVGPPFAPADVAILVVGKYVFRPVAMPPARVARTHLAEQFSNTPVVSPGPAVVIFDGIAHKYQGASSCRTCKDEFSISRPRAAALPPKWPLYIGPGYNGDSE